ncbi:hypothetical protein ATY41_06930 [Leifsonia xyli subsp. xyli]|nr:relaxase/mobilization nuclease domain-containing protein [Leifsonia xyli]ODA91115.1 hypothetical protein ATY41_06930 [Leifsonia xyli subsp. xyli]
MGQIKSTVEKALAYISRPDATSDGLWVSTSAAVINPSDFKAVAREFERTARRKAITAPRKGSVLAHHVIQSFPPGEAISANRAHQLGVQLAEQVTGGEHEYMIATHLDKGHVHNHIIFNAINFETGRKFHTDKHTIGKIRDLSDALCKAEGLSVLPPLQKPAAGRSFADIYRVMKGDRGKEYLRTEIDKAACRATSWNDFEAILARAGIEISVRGGRNGTVSFREISMSRPVRDFRLGAAYTEQSIMTLMSKSVVNMVGVDVSMVVKESLDTITVTVPGTQRELQLTVAKRQVVRHGRTLRMYVPAEEPQRLAYKNGNLTRTVTTAELYEFFSEPDLAAAFDGGKRKNTDTSLLAGCTPAIAALRELEERVNAKARWMRPDMLDATTALAQAREHLKEQRMTYQTVMVAAAEAMADPNGNPYQLEGLKAELRIIERDMATVSTDIRALTVLTTDEAKASIAERIGTTLTTSTAAAEPTAAAVTLERTDRAEHTEQQAAEESPVAGRRSAGAASVPAGTH